MAYDLALAERLRSVMNDRDGATESKMFGCAVFILNGNMCCGVIGDGLFLRLSAEEAATALGRPHTRLMDPSGKRMKTMIVVGPGGLASDQALEEWVELAVAIARALPPKLPKAERAAKAPKAASRPSRKPK